MKRWRGLERGGAWRKESPEIYGIEKSTLKLPKWTNKAVGINHDENQPFAIFREGDWFDGVNEGVGEMDAITYILNLIPESMDSALLIYDKAGERWVVYYSEATQICAWIELYKWPQKPEIKFDKEPINNLDALENTLKSLSRNEKVELLGMLKDRLAYKQRLAMFLMNASG